MNIVIGTPVRDIKGYSIGRWLKSIYALDWPDPIPIIIVDNTDDTRQVEFADFLNTKIADSGINSQLITSFSTKDVQGLESEPRLAKSREDMRSMLLEMGADVWFSVECDIILPPETLKVMTPYLKDFDMVNHCYPDRDDKLSEISGFGCALFNMNILKEFNFTDGGGYAMCDPLKPSCYYGNDSWLAIRLLRAGYKVMDMHNVLKIQHLSDSE